MDGRAADLYARERVGVEWLRSNRLLHRRSTHQGRAEFGYQWQGATWQFASLEHLERFKADPAAFAPAFGGYCAWAVSQGYTASADPRAWRIVDGRLYLNYSLEVQQTWERDVPGNIARGEANWPGVLDR